MDLGVFAGLETDRLIWHEDGPARAAVRFSWEVMGWAPFFGPWRGAASEGRKGIFPAYPFLIPGHLELCQLHTTDVK